jgi:hypothetical protein
MGDLDKGGNAQQQQQNYNSSSGLIGGGPGDRNGQQNMSQQYSANNLSYPTPGMMTKDKNGRPTS